ncbi:MAG: OpgC domain-containing protein [Methylococcales bacterium]|nr:OpgC domain-containing protein [Methylococcales bacterium]
MNNKLIAPYLEGKRDLRIDFLRGFIMVMLIANHMDSYSLYTAISYGRLGMITSAEGFVGLSGLVAGIVYTKKSLKLGFRATSQALIKRAGQLYFAKLFTVLIIAFIAREKLLDTYYLTHWVDPSTEYGVPTYPSLDGTWSELFIESALLLGGPHQIQVLGLYVFLLLFAPLAVFLLTSGKTWLLLVISWAMYIYNYYYNVNITGAGYESAFPTLTWQLLFYNGMAIGANFRYLQEQFPKNIYKILFWVSVIIWISSIVFSLSRANPRFWPSQTFSFIDRETYLKIFFYWFYKDTLKVGLLINNIAVYIVSFSLLSKYWNRVNKTIGWLLVPIGQSSLYVFILHVFILLFMFHFYGRHTTDMFLTNTLLQTAIYLLIWVMIKYRVLFGIIPR